MPVTGLDFWFCGPNRHQRRGERHAKAKRFKGSKAAKRAHRRHR